MHRSSVRLAAVSLCLFLFFCLPAFADARASVPLGFREVVSETGLAMWKKNRDYVTVVSPRDGAALRLLHGKMIPSEGAGTNFARRDVREWWEEWKQEEPGAVLLLNAQFFNTENPAKSPLAFSTKVNGIVYAGYGDGTEYGGKKMVLRVGDEKAVVEPYGDDAGSLYAYPERTVIVGLKPEVSKSGSVRKGRTFVGTRPDGSILLFTSAAATQRYAARILLAFGAERNGIMMLDGGGSTQLVHRGRLLIPAASRSASPTLRKVPLAIGVVTGLRTASE